MAIDLLDPKKLRSELHELGLTQRDLARFVRLPDEDVSRAVTGKPLTPEIVYRIALGVQQLKRGQR